MKQKPSSIACKEASSAETNGNRDKLRVSYEPTNQCDPGNCTLVTDTELGSVRREERTEDNCAGRALHVGRLLELPAGGQAIEPIPSRDYSLEQVVPISLHVDYWDDLGWKEPFAQPQFSERQSWLVHANGHKTSFTPHFFVSGTEVRDWRGDLGDQLKRVTAEPARATLASTLKPPALAQFPSQRPPPRLARAIHWLCLLRSPKTSSRRAFRQARTAASPCHTITSCGNGSGPLH